MTHHGWGMTASSTPDTGLPGTPGRSSAQPVAAAGPTAARPTPTAGYQRVRDTTYSDGNTSAMVSSASSTPMVKVSSAATDAEPSRPRSVRMPANASPRQDTEHGWWPLS